jgi:2-polyprenyl-3-methyl-5-hydroxy-6-metoxy-1,4-benzoquinol methylase
MKIIERLTRIRRFHEYGSHFLDLDVMQSRAVEDFNRRVLNGEIPFEEVPCLCGNDQFSLIASTERHGLIQSTVICVECGLVQSNPRIKATYYRYFYESDEYRKLYDGNHFIENFQSFFTDDHGNHIYHAIIKHKPLKEINSVLEFGAGGGWNLIPFIRMGIAVKGYDHSSALVKLGNENGIDLSCGSIDSIEGEHDVIILNHVIEHFTHLLDDIKKLKSHLNNGGVMYVGVPDIQKFRIGHLQNAHIHYFTPKTLQYYLAKCGLKMVQLQPETGGHMSGIFIVDQPQVDDKFLGGHYEEMVKLLKRYSRTYYPRRLLNKALQLLKLQKTAQFLSKRFINYG